MRKLLLVILILAIAGGSGVPLTDLDQDGLSTGYELRENLVPITADPDGDQLNDADELRIGTNPYNADTDNDGLPDGVETNPPNHLEGADPLHKDIFLEIDLANGSTIPERDLNKLQTAFSNAPLNNPDGTTGVDVHYTIQHESIPSKITLEDYNNKIYHNTFDYTGEGYYHVVIVESVLDYPSGVCCVNENGFIVEMNPRDYTGFTVMHELGHALGLRTNDYRGIDTKQVPYSEYPSVMNYNGVGHGYTFSTGTGFNDWKHIKTHLDNINTSNLDTNDEPNSN